MTTQYAGVLALVLCAALVPGKGLAAPGDPPPPCTPGIPCLEYTPDTEANKDKAEFSDLRKTCDGDVMNQIHARAFLEAQREHMINQVAIRKPDSVLAYTCYDQYVGVAASKAPPIFSQSTDWSGKNVPLSVTGKPPGSYPANRILQIYMGSDHIDTFLSQMTIGPISKFLENNFRHNFLGDTAGFSYNINTLPSTAAMTCSSMQQVWQTAKCQNLDADPFLSFEELATKDPRTLVGNCNAPKISTQYIAVAANKAPEYKQFKSGQVTPPYSFVKVDGIRHLNEKNKDDYFDAKLKPFDGVGDGCAPPVKTGVMLIERVGSLNEQGDIETSEPKQYQDAACPNPECFYLKGMEGGLGTCLPNTGIGD